MRWNVQERECEVSTTTPERAPCRFARGTQELVRMTVDERERLIEDDVAEIVHDLKSPLSAITLEAVLLEDKIARGERISSIQAIARINHNVAYLDRLVLDLLDVCSIAAGQLRLCRIATDLSELIERVVTRLVSPVHRGRVFVHAEPAVTLMIDELRIERVIANLVENALKYTPVTSEIVVRLAYTHDGVMVSVSDTGPGISPLELPYIFERYRRAQSSRGRMGSGLGLYVCKKIVEAHGGTIGVESDRGSGSRFFFELPAIQAT
jgi:signal transduction histidine kinase